MAVWADLEVVLRRSIDDLTRVEGWEKAGGFLATLLMQIGLVMPAMKDLQLEAEHQRSFVCSCQGKYQGKKLQQKSL